MRVGVYPGTFDPITNGHLDIIRRGSKLVDKLIVAVARNAGKGPLFSLDERVEMVQDEINKLNTAHKGDGVHGEIVVVSFGNLLMHFVEENGAATIIRGLRAVSDFEYEFQMVGMNARLNADVETVFLMASDRNQFISSRLVKEIANMGGAIDQFVPERVVARVQDKFQ
ncbi:pantetheine-phosphate adenylyltransferase [Nisaea denitrificans]|uniref:pantetheine-phosphate adenylyltransferase n=1 Tax=Nisaea denitrificans TaxID=390877 RepID=UPI0003F702A9|nr:pantetheine-phosphate adenylyltransferase [Nisaea denitrificans]